RQGERRDRELMLPLHPHNGAAGEQQFYLWAAGQQACKVRCCRNQPLKVIKHEQYAMLVERHLYCVEQGPLLGFLDSKCLRELGYHQVWTLQRRQRNEPDAIGEVSAHLAGDLQCQPGLSNASRAGEGDQTHRWATQEALHCLHLCLAPYQGREWQGNRGSGRKRKREGTATSLCSRTVGQRFRRCRCSMALQ